jgi:hypothetical protein
MNPEPEHGPESGHHHPGLGQTHRRKWHRDWRVWVMVAIMLMAIAIYVLTLDLR